MTLNWLLRPVLGPKRRSMYDRSGPVLSPEEGLQCTFAVRLQALVPRQQVSHARLGLRAGMLKTDGQGRSA